MSSCSIQKMIVRVKCTIKMHPESPKETRLTCMIMKELLHAIIAIFNKSQQSRSICTQCKIKAREGFTLMF